MAETPSARPDDRAEGFDSITLISPDRSTEAQFVPEANMLCCSLRHQGVELLDEGRGIHAYAERGKTMGVPLLHPWANRLAGFEYQADGKAVSLAGAGSRIPLDSAGLPIHGVLPGLLRWGVEGSGPDRMSARLHWSSAELLELFPFVHELRLDAVLTTGALKITTTLAATGSDRVPVSFGYHPYVRIPGSSRRSWRVELAARRRLLLDERMIPTGETEPLEHRSFELADTSWDDAFDSPSEPAVFQIARDRETVAVELVSGYPYAQVYAPAGKDFICFEPMTAPTNALGSGAGLQLVEPGGQHRAVFRIASSGFGAPHHGPPE